MYKKNTCKNLFLLWTITHTTNPSVINSLYNTILYKLNQSPLFHSRNYQNSWILIIMIREYSKHGFQKIYDEIREKKRNYQGLVSTSISQCCLRKLSRESWHLLSRINRWRQLSSWGILRIKPQLII